MPGPLPQQVLLCWAEVLFSWVEESTKGKKLDTQCGIRALERFGFEESGDD